MFEKFVNFILWIGGLQIQSCDPFLNQYRGYQRRMVASVGFTLFVVLLGWLFFPEESAGGQHSVILASIAPYFKAFWYLAITVSCAFFMVNAIQFWRFCIR